MTDRELLELAAKAAGVDLEWDGPPDIWQPMYYQGKTYHKWDPRTDDGDALRLAVKLEMMIDTVNRVVAGYTSDIVVDIDFEEQEKDPYAATRRAIVRAAAEIGKDMR